MDQRAFPGALSAARKSARLSQSGLADALGISQKHVSFLETGRSRPSRGMALRLAETLRLGPEGTDHLLEAAGHARQYGARDLSDRELAPFVEAARCLSDKQAPYPAFIIDRYWGLIEANAPAAKFAAALGLDLNAEAFLFNGRPNMLLALFHPEGLAPRLGDGGGFDRQVLRVLQQMQSTRPGEQVAGELIGRLEPLIDSLLTTGEEGETPTLPLIPLVLELEDGNKISWFSTIAALGTPLDATLEALRVELLFPLDEGTRTWAEENLA